MPKKGKNNASTNESWRQNSKPGAAAWGNDSSISSFGNTVKLGTTSLALAKVESNSEDVDSWSDEPEEMSMAHFWGAMPSTLEIVEHKKTRGNKPDFGGSQEQIAFYIGTSKKEFPVYKKFAVYHSPVLAIALNPPFPTGRAQKYTMEDTTEAAFALFLQWIHTQSLNIESREYTRAISDVTEEGQAYFRLWVLAGKLMMPELQNRAIDLIQQMHLVHCTIWIHEIQYIYKNTSQGSPLRRVMVDQIPWGLGAEHIRAHAGSFTQESLLDIACASRELLTAYSNNKRLVMADYRVKEDK